MKIPKRGINQDEVISIFSNQENDGINQEIYSLGEESDEINFRLIIEVNKHPGRNHI